MKIFDDFFIDEIIDDNAIKVDYIKRPKNKPIEKIKIDGNTYYITDLGDQIVSFLYKSFAKERVKGTVIANIFDKKLCKGKSYMALNRKYTEKIIEFNGDYHYDVYLTDKISECIFNILNKKG